MEQLFDIQVESRRLKEIGPVDEARRDKIVATCQRVLDKAADMAPVGAWDLVATDVVKARAMLDASTPENVKAAAINALVVFNAALTAEGWAEDKREQTYREAYETFDKIITRGSVTLVTVAFIAIGLWGFVQYRRLVA